MSYITGYVLHAIRARDALIDAVDRKDRAAFGEAHERFFPREYDATKTPLALAVREARKMGELSILLPKLLAIDRALRKLASLSAPCFTSPAVWRLNRAVNELLPLVPGPAVSRDDRGNGSDEKLVTVAQARTLLAAEGLAVPSPAAFTRATKKRPAEYGHLPHLKSGRNVLVKMSEVRRFAHDSESRRLDPQRIAVSLVAKNQKI